MDEVLFFLLMKNAHRVPIRITTSEIGKQIGMSQQNVSRRVVELEGFEMIRRTGNRIMITKKGMEFAKIEYLQLKGAFEGSSIRIEGKAVQGLGEGKYYVSIPEYKKQMKEKFGFEPYPGTLNIKLEENEIPKRELILERDPITIKGFEKNGRAFGDIYSYKAKLNGINAKTNGVSTKTSGRSVYIIFPLRTHHGKEIIEIVAEKRLFEKFKGGKIIIELE